MTAPPLWAGRRAYYHTRRCVSRRGAGERKLPGPQNTVGFTPHICSIYVYVKEIMTLLVKSKTRCKVILHPTFAGKKTAIMALVKCALMTWKFHCCDLTNRVNHVEDWFSI